MFQLRIALTEIESIIVLEGSPEIFVASLASLFLRSPAFFRVAQFDGKIGRLHGTHAAVEVPDPKPTGKFRLRHIGKSDTATAWYYAYGYKPHIQLTCNLVMTSCAPKVFATLELAKEACKTLGSRTYKPEEILA